MGEKMKKKGLIVRKVQESSKKNNTAHTATDEPKLHCKLQNW